MSREPCFLEELAEVTLAGPGAPRLVVDVGVELSRGGPDSADRRLSTGEVPDARGDDTADRVTRAISRIPATGRS